MSTDHPNVAAFPEARRELVKANRILAAQGVVDGFGHVSVRLTAQPDYFLLSRSMAPALVTESDVYVYDLSAEADHSLTTNSYLERFIHSEIYSARPDVQAVVHSHSPNVIPFACVGNCHLQPIFHMAGFLAEGVSRFEIRDHATTPTDMLVRDAALGRALGETLGAGTVVLMRGHGSTTVAASLRQAVYRAVYTELNARIQITAQSMGAVQFLGAAEARCAAAAADRQVDRCWDLWAREAAGAGAAMPSSPV